MEPEACLTFGLHPSSTTLWLCELRFSPYFSQSRFLMWKMGMMLPISWSCAKTRHWISEIQPGMKQIIIIYFKIQLYLHFKLSNNHITDNSKGRKGHAGSLPPSPLPTPSLLPQSPCYQVPTFYQRDLHMYV